jgi:hypothetical protein
MLSKILLAVLLFHWDKEDKKRVLGLVLSSTSFPSLKSLPLKNSPSLLSKILASLPFGLWYSHSSSTELLLIEKPFETL